MVGRALTCLNSSFLLFESRILFESGLRAGVVDNTGIVGVLRQMTLGHEYSDFTGLPRVFNDRNSKTDFLQVPGGKLRGME
jgi:hypothetical protein